MDDLEPIFRMTCEECGLPALTFDESNRSFCGKHAAKLIRVQRAERRDDDWDFDPPG